MSDTDPKAVMDEWMVAKKGLAIAKTELKAAQAGHEVAARCEREAWEKIAKLCGREPFPPAPPQAPPVQVFTAPSTQVVSTGRLIEQEPRLSYLTWPVTASYRTSTNGFDTRVRP